MDDTAGSDFAVGQVWTYKGAQAPSSRIVVGAIGEGRKGGTAAIISICVLDVFFPDARSGESRWQLLTHIPMASEALAESVFYLEGHGDVPDGFEDGYLAWKDEAPGSYFEIAVCELIEGFQQAFARRETQ